MVELLRTKLFIPRPWKNLAARPRVVDCLNEALDKKLTLIAAPAGFGKTTWLSEWIPQSPRDVLGFHSLPSRGYFTYLRVFWT